MGDNNLRIRKVPVNAFVETLIDLYNKGVDYVDIIGVLNNDQDAIGISFCKEYMSKKLQKNFDKIPNTTIEKNEINIKLSDDDLNQLI
jgi:pyrimidine operon attenuation protein/uracil phosphoribosyltransferase